MSAQADDGPAHEAVGPFIVPDARGWTAGYSIGCSCGWESGELRVLDNQDPAHRAPQVAAIKDHWRHLLEVVTPMKEIA